MSNRSRLDVALRQIEFAREYTLSLIDDFDEKQWFTTPQGSVTHLAWQLGHLAVAQYGLCLFRIRGRLPLDSDLMSSTFRKKFSKGTTPDPAPQSNPPPSEIRAVFDQVHQQAKAELAGLTDRDLADAIDMPYAVEATKLGGLYFCALHEMLHAGQIGALRRLLGKEPVR
jgi:hypothetical protein